MKYLSRLSVSATLNGVFVALAAALCIAIGLQITAAWNASRESARLGSIASANRILFDAVQQLRLLQSDAQNAFLNRDDGAGAIHEDYLKSQALLASALAAVRQVNGSNGGGNIEALAGEAQTKWDFSCRAGTTRSGLRPNPRAAAT